MWPIWVVVNILDFMNLSNVTNIIEVPNCTRRKKICEMRKKMPVSTFSLDAITQYFKSKGQICPKTIVGLIHQIKAVNLSEIF